MNADDNNIINIVILIDFTQSGNPYYKNRVLTTNVDNYNEKNMKNILLILVCNEMTFTSTIGRHLESLAVPRKTGTHYGSIL